MYRLFYLIIFLSLFSCVKEQTVKESPQEEVVSFSMDTVMIDPGEELISLPYRLKASALNLEENLLYIFNEKGPFLYQIDLKTNSLAGKTLFQKEGPDGFGVFVMGLQLLDDRTLYFNTFQNSVFTFEGKKLRDIAKSISALELPADLDPLSLSLGSVYHSEQNQLFVAALNIHDGSRRFVRVDFEEKNVELFDFPEWERAKDFRVELGGAGGGRIHVEQINSQLIEDKVIVYSTFDSGIYVFDLKTDSLAYLSFIHQLVPQKKLASNAVKVASNEEWEAEVAKLTSQVSFGKMMWEPRRNYFLRLAHKTINPEASFENQKFETFLFKYDANLDLRGEYSLGTFPRFAEEYFLFKEKIYFDVNVEDELGFAVLTSDF